MRPFLILVTCNTLFFSGCTSDKINFESLLVNKKGDADISIIQEVGNNVRCIKNYYYEPTHQVVLKSFIVQTDDTIKNVNSVVKHYLEFLIRRKAISNDMDISLEYDSLKQKYTRAYINNRKVELLFSEKHEGVEFINIETDSCAYELKIKDEFSTFINQYDPPIDTLKIRYSKR